MAPCKIPRRVLKLNEKELTLWPKCKKGVAVPCNYVSLHSAGRNFAISFKVQWNKSSPGSSASHYSDQSIIKLDFLAA